jgi:hypothetical protein
MIKPKKTPTARLSDGPGLVAVLLRTAETRLGRWRTIVDYICSKLTNAPYKFIY